MKSFICVLVFATFASAWGWFWPKPETPEWSKLSVTFLKFSGLPISENDAEALGWTKTHSCGNGSHFAGNRYVLNGDTAVMLLFDSNGKIAGIQNGILKSNGTKPLRAPWVSEDNMYVITAYFTDPQDICSGSRPATKYLGDKLILQTGPQLSNRMEIPFKQEDLEGTAWVRGGCFFGMGRHYWYNITVDMNCDDFYPMFLLYNKDRLTGFGWVMQGHILSPRYEHPTPRSLSGIGFFPYGKMPKCILGLKSLSSEHVYLDKRPYLNLCL